MPSPSPPVHESTSSTFQNQSSPHQPPATSPSPIPSVQHNPPTNYSSSAPDSPPPIVTPSTLSSPISAPTLLDPPTPSSPSTPATSSPPLEKCQRKPNPKYYNPAYIKHTTLHPLPMSLEPNTHNQASKDPRWHEAMDSEYNVLLQNHTWELVPSTNHTPIGCKWIFRTKRNPDGSIYKYKARLVAKGYLQ